MASTKAFTSQMIALIFRYILPITRNVTDDESRPTRKLAELPVKMENLLNGADAIEDLAKEFFRSTDFLPRSWITLRSP